MESDSTTNRAELQQLGYRISIDDINLENKHVVIVDTIIAMAQHLKLNLIAEGVESQYQVDYLVKQGCLGFQGYYFSKPIPTEEVLSNHMEKQH